MSIKQFYQQYKQDVFRYLVHLTGDATLAEDLLSETFLGAMKSLPRFRGDSGVKTWLFSIARHKWYEHLRKPRETPYIEDDTVTAQRATEILLDIRSILDEAGITFARVDLELIKPRINDQPNPDKTRFGVADFPYAEIYEEGLLQRLTEAADTLNDYHTQQDALKGAEIQRPE